MWGEPFSISNIYITSMVRDCDLLAASKQQQASEQESKLVAETKKAKRIAKEEKEGAMRAEF